MTRRDFLVAAGAVLAVPRAPIHLRPALSSSKLRSKGPAPSPPQLAWQRDELAIFVHFGVNTFTDREWGDGKEDPAIFAPGALDARQWARAARAGGFRAVILTARHHDGFCLWPTRTTEHSVRRSPFRAGGGDVVREFVDACRAEGLRPGLYLSPWDRNNPVYGDSPRYNDLYCDQLTELLTNYGSLSEVCFDGANGEGPNGRRQVYDWPRVFALVRRLQPNAVVFSDAGPDVRWCGNENGTAGEPNWSTVDPAAVPYPGASGPGITEALQHGHPDGRVWRPAEADTSIRPGWFYHPAQDGRVRTAAQLVDLYFKSVGRNAKLLLNVPPTRDGLLHEIDVARLAGMRERLRALFAVDLARGRRVAAVRGGLAPAFEVDLGRTLTPSIVRLAEDITKGQAAARYTLHAQLPTPNSQLGGEWRVLSSGATIGYARIDRFEPVPARRLRVVVENAVSAPGPLTIQVFAGE